MAGSITSGLHLIWRLGRAELLLALAQLSWLGAGAMMIIVVFVYPINRPAPKASRLYNIRPFVDKSSRTNPPALTP